MESEVDNLKEKIKGLEEKVEILSEKLDNIMSELFDEDYENAENGVEVICPYCNFEFNSDINDETKEIKCPECENIIELDWNDQDNGENGCGCDCHHCHGCE